MNQINLSELQNIPVKDFYEIINKLYLEKKIDLKTRQKIIKLYTTEKKKYFFQKLEKFILFFSVFCIFLWLFLLWLWIFF